MIDSSKVGVVAYTGGHPDDMALLRSISENQGVVIITPDLHRGMEVGINDFNPFEAEAVDIEHSNERKVLVVGGSNSSLLNAAISEVLGNQFSKAFEAFTESIPSFANTFSYRWDYSFCYTPDWRWSDLHHKLSLEATLLKEKKVQQRRQALFKHHQEKRAKKGRSHAKQRAKSAKRFA